MKSANSELLSFEAALKAFNLPRSISTCYDFGGRVTCDQLPTEIRTDGHGSSAHYLPIPRQNWTCMVTGSRITLR